MSGPNMHVHGKSVHLLKVRVHPFRNVSYPRNSLRGLCDLDQRRRMGYPSYPLCKAGKRVAVRSSHASRNSWGRPILGAIRAKPGCVRSLLGGGFLPFVCDAYELKRRLVISQDPFADPKPAPAQPSVLAQSTAVVSPAETVHVPE